MAGGEAEPGLQQLSLTLLQPPNPATRPQKGGWSTHLSLRRGGHPRVLSERASLGPGHSGLGPGSAAVLVGSRAAHTGWPGKGDTPQPSLSFTTTSTTRQRSAELLERPPPPPPSFPRRNPKPPIFVFSFLLLGRFPAIKPFLGALQRKSGRPSHLLNQSEQCRAEGPPAAPRLAPAGSGKGPRNRPEGPGVTPEQVVGG